MELVVDDYFSVSGKLKLPPNAYSVTLFVNLNKYTPEVLINDLLSIYDKCETIWIRIDHTRLSLKKIYLFLEVLDLILVNKLSKIRVASHKIEKIEDSNLIYLLNYLTRNYLTLSDTEKVDINYVDKFTQSRIPIKEIS